MKRLILLFCTLFPLALAAQPCTLTNSGGCDCLDGSNDCDLLPDIQLSRDLLMDASENPEIAGELGVSVSTPNTGHGPLRVIATDYYVCGSDTILSPGGYSGICPDGTSPRQLIKQRIYHKNPDASMTYEDRWAGSMTYHASHGHMHVDDWGIYSLRTPTADPNPLNWPIVADGAKLGFCLMDFGSCSYYYGHCRDAADGILTTDAPNYGLGGGGYSCGLTNQGITAGWTDIYHYYLDGMQIDIPASVCNGDYMLVVYVDPNNYFLEENDDNNVMAVPITLTQQTGFSSFDIAVDDGYTTLCAGQIATLSVPFSAESYVWSNGMTGSSISVTEPGTYSVTVTSAACGAVTSEDVAIAFVDIDPPLAQGDSVCTSGSMTLTAESADGPVYWYDAAEGGTLLAEGNTFITPVLTSTTSYFATAEKNIPGSTEFSAPHDHTGVSLYSGSTFNGYLIVDVQKTVLLKSVKVYTDEAGLRTIEWRNAAGVVLESITADIPVGESRVEINFTLTPGIDYQLGTQTAQNLLTLGTESPRLQRSNSGVAMPYNLPGKLTIKDTNFGNALYYYFFDWEVAEPDLTCEGPRQEVTAQVKLCTGLDDAWSYAEVQIAPNPASEQATLQVALQQPGMLEIRLLELTGRLLLQETLGQAQDQFQYTLNTSNLASGIYIVELLANGQSYRQKLQVSRP